VPAQVAAMMIDYDRQATHFEVVDAGALPALTPAVRLPGRRQVCDLLSITVAVALRVSKFSLEGPTMLPAWGCASRSVATAVAARTLALGGRFCVAPPLHR